MRQIIAVMFLVVFVGHAFAAPDHFRQAKIELRQNVFFDQTLAGEMYCGCQWQWAGESGGIVDHKSCGYQPRAQANRAARIEWEHIMPASNFGRARQCWQNGGRQNCNATDSVFNRMEADMHNLAPAVGEVNADRSNFNFGQLTGTEGTYGSCDFKVSFSGRTAEPRDQVKGHVARTYFYMADRYKVRLSDQQQRLLMAWDKQFPVTEHERLIESRVAARMGHHNEYITGARTWTFGQKNSGSGLIGAAQPQLIQAPVKQAESKATVAAVTAIRGNKNSMIYHIAGSCPDFDRIGLNNRVSFGSEASAVAAGYRKAKNCR